jgi:D-glycero-alpha-D-manno-heptose-7-phosphate kinase
VIRQELFASIDPQRETQPHFISRTPFRLSFFGGGSDYPAWYLKRGGAVLSAAINKYCYISCRTLPPFFGIRHRIVWSHIETVNSISEILHPAVRIGLRMLGHQDSDGIELHHQGDLPARSGIGSSSSFAVGMINAVSAMHGKRLTKHELALAAIDLEQNWLKDHVGSQDQVAAAYGGINVIRFNTDGSIAVQPVALSVDRRAVLEGRLMMFFAGTTRLSTDLAKQLIDNLDAKQREIEAMERIMHQAIATFEGGELDDIGRQLHESWLLKRGLTSSITNQTVDDIYKAARAAGALGGKLLGAGQAGFMAFYVPERHQRSVRTALHHLIEVPVRFDYSGATLINLDEA